MSTFLTIPQFAEKHPAFKVSGLRWLRFHASTNGMGLAFVKNGRRVLVDEDEFFNAVRRKAVAPNSVIAAQ